MKSTMYLNYSSRSLVRGGQRTVLAIFCVAVGVMAIVTLQLVGLMINNAFNSNVRDANGGDIAVSSRNAPFVESDQSYFDGLKKDGTISNYTFITTSQGSMSVSSSLTQRFNIQAVDPGNYPLVTSPTFINPQNSSIANLLKNDQVVITQSFSTQYKKNIGDNFDIHTGDQNQAGRILHVKVAGVVNNDGALTQSGSLVLISQKDFQAASVGVEPTYDTVYVTTSSQANTDDAVKKIEGQYPIANVQTAADALKAQQSSIDNVRYFLEIAGLLALLIGGIGIVNTMQVLLSRRKTEIAMLKTTGYRRVSLYLLFGLEAGMLGLAGGVIGTAAATGVSYLVRNLVQQLFLLRIPFVLDPPTLAGGVAIGIVTSLIFGLLPIAQAANIRPLNVIREIPEAARAGSIALTLGLLAIVSVLFCVLAIVILNGNVLLGAIAVYGAFIFLSLLSLLFSLLIMCIGKLPVPEKFSLPFVSFVLAGIIISSLITIVLPAFGILLLLISLLGLVVVLLPRTWKASIKIALRNLSRQQGRTATTMLALFVGIFTIGLIIVLGQNLRDEINKVLANSLDFNLIAVTSRDSAPTLEQKLNTINGLTSHREVSTTSTSVETINGQPISAVLPPDSSSGKESGRYVASFRSLGRAGALYFLSGIEGYDVAHNQFPNTQSLKITAGRNLDAGDAGKNNVLIAAPLATLDPLHMKVGDTITFSSIDRKTTETVTVVGVYQTQGFGGNTRPVLGTLDLVNSLSTSASAEQVFYLKVDSSKVSKAVADIGDIVPTAAVLNLANVGDVINQYLSDILWTLTTIASLSLLAGVIIIANAVALAMLERRRELGIFKSVGYTSSTILSGVLMENGVIGGTGALTAMLLVTLATSLLGHFLFKISFGVNGFVAIGLIAGATLLAIITAVLVAWGAVRVRPLEVLRYE